MIESAGTKFFKSITETADDLGGDADTLALEFTSLSVLIKIVLFVLTILLLLIIFKYSTLGILFLKNRWLESHMQSSKTQFFNVLAPVKIEMEPTDFKKQDDSLGIVVRLQNITSDGQFLLLKLSKDKKYQDQE